MKMNARAIVVRTEEGSDSFTATRQVRCVLCAGSPEPGKEKCIKAGRVVYRTCSACHGAGFYDMPMQPNKQGGIK